jgi:hypothetical protein
MLPYRLLKSLITLSVVGFWIAAPVAFASEEELPAAIVEEAHESRTDIQTMDFLVAGQKLVLKDGEVLTLVYLASCLQETITGGTVTIGARQSRIANGHVNRIGVVCEDADMELS